MQMLATMILYAQERRFVVTLGKAQTLTHVATQRIRNSIIHAKTICVLSSLLPLQASQVLKRNIIFHTRPTNMSATQDTFDTRGIKKHTSQIPERFHDSKMKNFRRHKMSRRGVCRLFARDGKCKYGDNCRFQHELK